MLKITVTLCAAAVAASAVAQTLSLADMADIIDNRTCQAAHVDYEVLMPSAQDPVVYAIELQSQGTPADTLNPCEYLIDWTLPRPGGQSHGFAAYYNGNHYRYRDMKLQEYHVADDATPFAGQRGVQRMAQFVSLLGPSVAAQLRQMAADSAYQYTIVQNADAILVTGLQTVKGYDVLQFDYAFDPVTMLPQRMDMIYNPASISEQNVTATYTWNPNPDCLALTDQMLQATYPEVFAKYRSSNFHVLNIVGQPLPAITAPTPTRERYSRNRGEAFRAPTLMVFLDSHVATAAQTVSLIRQAVAQSPVTAQVVYVFGDNDTEAIDSIVGHLQPDETVLMSARGAIADCGVTAFPTVIFCNSNGVVADIELAVNNQPVDIVTQKIALCN